TLNQQESDDGLSWRLRSFRASRTQPRAAALSGAGGGVFWCVWSRLLQQRKEWFFLFGLGLVCFLRAGESLPCFCFFKALKDNYNRPLGRHSASRNGSGLARTN